MTFKKFIQALAVGALAAMLALLVAVIIVDLVNRISKHEDERYKQTTTIMEQKI